MLGADGEFVSYNLFAYCGCNPVNCADPRGLKKWYIDENGNQREESIRKAIIYSVPMYEQGQTSLCWAYCMVMRNSYDTGITLSAEEAYAEAERLDRNYYPMFNRHGLPFFLQGKRAACRSIEDLYYILCTEGPVYAAYRYKNIYGGHIVLVTGVDLDYGYIYTNNPWGEFGIQTEAEFFDSFVNKNHNEEPGYWFAGIYIPTS